METILAAAYVKTRYAVILHKINPNISIAAWQQSLRVGISNRRGGRFDKLRFHPAEMSDFIIKLTECDKYKDKLIACPQEPRMLPEGVMDMLDYQKRAACFLAGGNGSTARDVYVLRAPNARVTHLPSSTTRLGSNSTRMATASSSRWPPRTT